MILANRAVILCKINEFNWAIQDLNSAIQTGRYPPENIYKLHQRLSKAHEQLGEFELAANNYKNLINSIELSKATKAQKLQIKNEAGKSMAQCKKRVTATHFTSFESNGKQITQSSFPAYKAAHHQIQNASGLNILLKDVKL